MSETKEDEKLTLEAFEVGMGLKLVNAVLEIVGGTLFFFVKPGTWQSLVLRLTQHELLTDPRDLVANYLRNVSAGLTLRGAHFTGLFLFSHGIIKVFLIYGLLKRILWVYPVAVATFSGFIVYQIYRYTISGSPWLIVLSLFDLVIVILTILEYNNLKREGAKHVS